MAIFIDSSGRSSLQERGIARWVFGTSCNAGRQNGVESWAVDFRGKHRIAVRELCVHGPA